MKAHFNWQDPFLLADQLSDEERAIVEAAHSFCQDKLQTRVLMAARHEKFDREIMNEAGAMGLLGSTIEGYGCAGLSYVATA
jgi:glutaryl-CoA dehydrogenase